MRTKGALPTPLLHPKSLTRAATISSVLVHLLLYAATACPVATDLCQDVLALYLWDQQDLHLNVSHGVIIHRLLRTVGWSGAMVNNQQFVMPVKAQLGTPF